MRKKGIMAFNFLAMVPRILFLVIMLIVCVILIRLFLNNRFDIADVQAEIFVNGFIYGTGGVTYTDPLTGRIFPEIIDVSQFNSSELDASLFYPDNRMIAAKIIVTRDLSFVDAVAIAYYNKQWYDNWEPLLPLKSLPGIGGVTDYTKTLPIMLKEGESLKAAYVTFHVVQPKSARAKK
jgi:hypothetical protein